MKFVVRPVKIEFAFAGGCRGNCSGNCFAKCGSLGF